MIRINGKEISAENLSLTEYLQKNGYQVNRVAVEVNGDIVPKARYAETILISGDTVEIVNFVGGG